MTVTPMQQDFGGGPPGRPGRRSLPREKRPRRRLAAGANARLNDISSAGYPMIGILRVNGLNVEILLMSCEFVSFSPTFAGITVREPTN